MNLLKSNVSTMNCLDFDEASRLFSYNQVDGLLTRKVTTGKTSKSGCNPGNINRDGYIHIGIQGTTYKAHRIIFLIMTGRNANGHIDHINGDRSDNRWSNLREVSPSGNARNKCLQRNNASGISGVAYRYDQNRWQARISNIYIGTFMDLFSACCARKSKELELLYHKNHGRNSKLYPLNNEQLAAKGVE